MDPARGFISLARSFDESDIFQNEKWLKVFIWCLIQANHKDKNVPVKTGRSKTVVKVKRGQFIFGRNKAAERLNMSPSTVRNIMEKLQVLESISMQKDNHYSIVTLCNYDEYQSVEFFKGQPTDNQRTTNGQPTDTTNNDNNDNNDNKKTLKKSRRTISPVDNKQAFIDQLPESITIKHQMNLINETTDRLIDYCLSSGKTYKDYYAALRNFLRSSKTTFKKIENKSLSQLVEERRKKNKPDFDIEIQAEA